MKHFTSHSVSLLSSSLSKTHHNSDGSSTTVVSAVAGVDFLAATSSTKRVPGFARNLFANQVLSSSHFVHICSSIGMAGVVNVSKMSHSDALTPASTVSGGNAKISLVLQGLFKVWVCCAL